MLSYIKVNDASLVTRMTAPTTLGRCLLAKQLLNLLNLKRNELVLRAQD
jgi:hypothetical protein